MHKVTSDYMIFQQLVYFQTDATKYIIRSLHNNVPQLNYLFVMMLIIITKVILMQRGSDPDGPAGLFTVGSSYAVAFADRGDATNFCFLLVSFFEDLGDVSVDIVTMSAKVKDSKLVFLVFFFRLKL